MTATLLLAAARPAAAQTGPIVAVTVIDAADQSTIATLTDGATYELDDPGSRSIGFVVDASGASPSQVRSVEIVLGGQRSVTRTENVAPYSLYGDDGADAIMGETLPAGDYTLTARAYNGANLGGVLLGTVSYSFDVTVAPAPPAGASEVLVVAPDPPPAPTTSTTVPLALGGAGWSAAAPDAQMGPLLVPVVTATVLGLLLLLGTGWAFGLLRTVSARALDGLRGLVRRT